MTHQSPGKRRVSSFLADGPLRSPIRISRTSFQVASFHAHELTPALPGHGGNFALSRSVRSMPQIDTRVIVDLSGFRHASRPGPLASFLPAGKVFPLYRNASTGAEFNKPLTVGRNEQLLPIGNVQLTKDRGKVMADCRF